jgi:hypothetical protein
MKTSNHLSLAKLWIFNYDFEFELAKKNSISFDVSSSYPWHYLNRSTNLLLPLTIPEDSILVYEAPPDAIQSALADKLGYLPNYISFKTEVESNSLLDDLASVDKLEEIFSRNLPLSPWGWSKKSFQFQKKLDQATPLNYSVVRQINAKCFSHHLRDQFLPPQFSIPAKSIETALTVHELESELNDFHHHHSNFFIKHNYGTAGYLADYCASTDFTNRKLKKWKSWLNQGGGLLLEKQESVADEYSLQLEIEDENRIHSLVLTNLLSRRDSHYQGTVIDDSFARLKEKLTHQLSSVINQLGKTGYVGPVGIDLIKTGSGDYKLLEINARLTMGRVAYEWHRKVNPYPMGILSHLFLKHRKLKSPEAIVECCHRLEEKYLCSIFLFNLIVQRNNLISMIGFFIGSETTENIWNAVDALRSALYVK